MASSTTTEVEYDEGHARTRITGDADGKGFGGSIRSSSQVMQETTVNEISDPTRLPGEAEYLTGATFWLLMLTLAAILVLISIDMNIVATAVPSIIAKIGLTQIVTSVSPAKSREVLVAIDQSLIQTWYLVVGLACATMVGSLLIEWRSFKTRRD